MSITKTLEHKIHIFFSRFKGVGITLDSSNSVLLWSHGPPIESSSKDDGTEGYL